MFDQELLLLLQIFGKEFLAGHEFFNHTLQTGQCPSFFTGRLFHGLMNFCRISPRTTIFINPALDFILYQLEDFSRIVPDLTFDVPSELGALRFSRNCSSLSLSVTAPVSRHSTPTSVHGKNFLTDSLPRCLLSKNCRKTWVPMSPSPKQSQRTLKMAVGLFNSLAG